MSLASYANKTILASNGNWDLQFEDGDTNDIITTMMKADKLANQYTFDFSKRFNFRTIADLKELWQFVLRNIKYVDDIEMYGEKESMQVIKSPAELWDSKVGDCKSFSIFIKSICSNAGLKGGYRFVRYANQDFVTHVYPWVWLKNRRVYLDAVKGAQFNQDDYYAEKIDYEWNTGAKIGESDPNNLVRFQWTPLKIAAVGVTGYFLIKKIFNA